MSSVSIKDVIKSIHTYIPTEALPLPDDLLELIQSYLDKHTPVEESESFKLHDELWSVFQKDVRDQPRRYAIFVAILRLLNPALRRSNRILQWWDALVVPVLGHIREQKGLAVEAHNIMLDILVYDDDDENVEGTAAAQISIEVSDRLLDTYIKQATLANTESDTAASYMERQIKRVLMAFGYKRQREFLTVVDKFFVKKEYRVQVLLLLCEYIRSEPPHLHLLLQTPLFNNLLRCLQIDTSTTVVALAMTALTMFLPSIPVSSGKHLPALFNIYTRMLFWDRERILSPSLRRDSTEKDDADDSDPQKGEKSAWEKSSYSFESDDETLPELSNYFTFLYGLYPINFMSYIRKPSRYLRHASFPGADDIEVEPSEIRQRSEPFRRLHLLHPNFFTLTIESELTDANRWMKSPTSDVVTACMALCVPVDHIASTNPSTIRLSSLHSVRESNRDIPSQPLLSHDLDDHYSSPRLSGASNGNIGNVSWRNTASTIVASPDGIGELSALRRLSSRNSQSVSSDLNSPTSQPQDVRSDSPGMHNLALSHSHGGLQDMLNSQKSLHGNLQQSLPNESSTSVSSAQLNDSSMTVDSYLQSLAQHPPRSPSLRPSAHDGQSNIAYLHREIMLLKNDLNFERYLKQQHLAHIGQLRRMQVREATVEAETQNLINSNKILKGKLDEAKSTTIQIKKESEKSRAQSRKWEADLTAKLRAIKEDQKQWSAESESLRKELIAIKEYCEQLKQLVISSEARELSSSRKLQSVQVELGELDKLRADVERLTKQLRGFQAQERENERVKASEDVALTKIELLEMQLKARDNELQKTRKANVREIDSLRSQLEMATTGIHSKQTKNFQSMLDSALAASRSRLAEAQKAHAHLLKQYTALEQQYLILQEQQDSTGPLLGEGMQSYMSESPTSEYRREPYHSHFDDRRDIFRTSDDSAEFRRDPFRDMSDVSPRSSTPTRMPMRMDATMRSSTTPSSSHGILRTISRGSSDVGVGSANGEADKAGAVKIKPQSEIRVYGRGGPQNIGKTAKEKKDAKDKADAEKALEREKAQEKDKDKKDKKGMTGSLRGLRGFTG